MNYKHVIHIIAGVIIKMHSKNICFLFYWIFIYFYVFVFVF